MAFTLEDLRGQFSSLFGGGNYQGNGVTTFGAGDTMQGMQASGGMLPGGATATFGAPQAAGALGGSGFGMNMGTAGMALGGLQAIGNMIQGQKAFKLAKDQFKFQKGIANANLNNSIKSYNNSLEDRLSARGHMEGRDVNETAAEIERKRLSR